MFPLERVVNMTRQQSFQRTNVPFYVWCMYDHVNVGPSNGTTGILELR